MIDDSKKPKYDSLYLIFNNTKENECFWFNDRAEAEEFLENNSNKINLSAPIKYSFDF